MSFSRAGHPNRKRKRPPSYYANSTPTGAITQTKSDHPALQKSDAGVAYSPASVAPSQYTSSPASGGGGGPPHYLPRSHFGSAYARDSPALRQLEEQVGPLLNPSSHELFNKYVMKSLARSYVRSLNQPFANGPRPGADAPTSVLPAFGPGPSQPSSAPVAAGSGTWTGGGDHPGGVAGPGSGEEPAPEGDGAEEVEAATQAPAAVLPNLPPNPAAAAAAEAGGGGGGGKKEEEKMEEGKAEEGKEGKDKKDGKPNPNPYGAGVNPGMAGLGGNYSGRDRRNPITPETGAQQTVGTANSIIGADPIVDEAEQSNPKEVMGGAEERANVGKGAYSGYEFCGPYDYPSRPSGRVDSTLTALGAWRSKTGEHQSSLWASRFTEKGKPAKREKYMKWSTKGGGSWKSLSSYDAMRTFHKNAARKEGSRWMAQLTEGTPLRSLMASSLKHKMEDIQTGKEGNEVKNEKMYGSVEDKQM